MVKLVVDNSLCRAHDLSPFVFSKLRDALSYWETTKARYAGYGKVRKYLMDKRGDFPTGLLYLVEETLKTLGIKYALDDRRKRPESRQGLFELSLDFDPYPEQKEAAEACLRESRGIICAPTGCGKSVIAALIVNALQVRTLIVVPSLELKRQLTEGLQAAFPRTRVGSLASSANIAVENVDALDTRKSIRGYDCVVVDEFHHSGAATYRKLNLRAWNEIYYKFGLTATPFRSKDEERLLLESVLSKKIYEIPYSVAVEKGYIAPIEVYYIELPPVPAKQRSYAVAYNDLIVDREDRNQMIVEIMDGLAREGKSTLCLVKQINHGEKLKELCEFPFPFVKGENDDNGSVINAFSTGRIPGIIGTTGVIGEGVDTKACEYVVLAGGGKSKNAFMQQVGRAFRKYPGKESGKIIIFKDFSHKWFKDHFKAVCKYLKQEYGIVPKPL